ncbi:MAG: hypothetical protein EA397_02200 [Deltaproteobacteria bacterium]|nr:MAG: hypothetical protein EA397_02200 [Deltaproteobacteria bacterium]
MRWPFLVALTACDPILTIDLTATVPVEVQGDYSAEDPGIALLRVETPTFSYRPVVTALCEPLDAPKTLRYDTSWVGCVPEDPHLAVAFRRALPEDWDAEAFCALEGLGDRGGGLNEDDFPGWQELPPQDGMDPTTEALFANPNESGRCISKTETHAFEIP